MLYIDNRTGSADLAPLLRSKKLPVTLTRMDFGDVSFMGLGPEGSPVNVGIEVKKLHDVLACICDGRFAGHQLPGMVNSYDQPWLLVEGLWRANAKTGILEYRPQGRAKRQIWKEATVGSRRFMYRDLWTWLFTISTKGGVSVALAQDWGQATTWISTLYSWWTTKGWDGHKSHLAFHDGTRNGRPYQRQSIFGTGSDKRLADKAVMMRPSLCRQVAAQLPGLGWEKSAWVAKRFRTVEELTRATKEELMEVEGIGVVLAGKIWESLRSVK